MPEFVRIDGCVHVVLDGDSVICHTATHDAADTEGNEALRWHPTTSTTVTCEACARIVRLCQGVKVGKTRRMDTFR